MVASAQIQRPWNTLQSVAGRPRQAAENDTSSSPYNVEQISCKRKSHMWLMRSPIESGIHSYARPTETVDIKSTYSRSVASYDSHPYIADGDFDIEERTISSTRDVVDYLVHFSSISPLISEVEHDVHEFEDSDTDSETDSDIDAEAQYITIPPESPWWKAPKSSDSLSLDTTLVDSEDDDIEDVPSSHSLSEVLQQQQFLVGIFHDELRRMMPSGTAYDDDWLKEVDAKLLLAPVDAFEEACMDSMVATSRSSSRSASIDLGSKPLPDVPVDLDDGEDEEQDDDDDDDDDSLSGWEWEYPCYAHRVTFVEAHPIADPRFVS